MKFITNSTYYLNISKVGYKYNLNLDAINLIYKFLLDMNINHIIDRWYKYVYRINIIPATYLIELNSKYAFYLTNKTIQTKLNLIIDNFNFRLINSHISKDWWINNLDNLLLGITTNLWEHGDNFTCEEWVLHYNYHNKIHKIITLLNT